MWEVLSEEASMPGELEAEADFSSRLFFNGSTSTTVSAAYAVAIVLAITLAIASVLGLVYFGVFSQVTGFSGRSDRRFDRGDSEEEDGDSLTSILEALSSLEERWNEAVEGRQYEKKKRKDLRTCFALAREMGSNQKDRAKLKMECYKSV